MQLAIRPRKRNRITCKEVFCPMRSSFHTLNMCTQPRCPYLRKITPSFITCDYPHDVKLPPRAVPTLPPLRIATYIGGGLGDTIRSTDIVLKLREKFPYAIIHAYAAKFAEDVFADNPYVNGAYTLKNVHWEKAIRDLKAKYNIVYDLKYVAKEIRNPGTPGLTNEREWKEKWEYWHQRFLIGNNEIGRLGYHCIQLTAASLNLPSDINVNLHVHHDPPFDLPEHYIVIAPESDSDYKWQSKMWQPEKWEELIERLDLPAVQVGVGQVKPLHGTINLVGKTSVRDLFAVIKKAQLIITIEGGVAHAAAALNKKAVVLFGPTPVPFFAYPNHIPVCANVCDPCWWKTPDWFTQCLRGTNFKCMRAISVDMVLAAIEKRRDS